MYTNNDRGRVYLNCKFRYPRSGVLSLGLGYITHIVNMIISQCIVSDTQVTVKARGPPVII